MLPGIRCTHCDNTHDNIGHEVQGVYDGVLYWVCAQCGWAFKRDFGDWTRLNEASERYADEYNSDRYRT